MYFFKIQFPPSSIWDPVIPILTSVHITHLDIKPPPKQSTLRSGSETHPWPSPFSYSEAQTFTDWWGRDAGDWVTPTVDHQSRKKCVDCGQSPTGHRAGQPPKVSSSLNVSIFLCHKCQHKVIDFSLNQELLEQLFCWVGLHLQIPTVIPRFLCIPVTQLIKDLLCFSKYLCDSLCLSVTLLPKCSTEVHS